MADIIYHNNSGLLRVKGVKKASDGSYLNDGAVKVTVVDTDGQEITGQTWPVTLTYITGSDGEYEATLSDQLDLSGLPKVRAVIDIDAGANLVAQIEYDLRVKTRKS